MGAAYVCLCMFVGCLQPIFTLLHFTLFVLGITAFILPMRFSFANKTLNFVNITYACTMHTYMYMYTLVTHVCTCTCTCTCIYNVHVHVHVYTMYMYRYVTHADPLECVTVTLTLYSLVWGVEVEEEFVNFRSPPATGTSSLHQRRRGLEWRR